MRDTAKAENMPGELKPSRPNSIASTGKNMTSSPSDRTVATGSKNSKESKRIDATSTNYRSDVLALNRVLFKSTLAPLPANVAAVVGKIVLTSSSSEMDDATATKLRDTIIQLGEDAEAELGHGFVAMDVLPPKAEERKLKRTQQMPFTNTTLPRAIIPEGLSVTIQTICEPKPGVAYGYTLQGFTPSQQIAQRSTVNGVDLAKHSRPAKDLYWLFFVVEFKAPAVGGNIYAAASQCAGGGSAAVMAVQTLCTAASQPNDSTHLTDSIAYSAAIDGAAADLHIHWYEAGDETYCLQRIHHYDLNRPEDIKKLRIHAKNIVDWGLGSRLEKIGTALDVILTKERKIRQAELKRRGEPLSPSVS